MKIERVMMKHEVEIVGTLLVRRLFIWCYRRLERITFLGEDGLPVFEISSLSHPELKDNKLIEKQKDIEDWLIIHIAQSLWFLGNHKLEDTFVWKIKTGKVNPKESKYLQRAVNCLLRRKLLKNLGRELIGKEMEGKYGEK